jgi:hypothetical protein
VVVLKPAEFQCTFRFNQQAVYALVAMLHDQLHFPTNRGRPLSVLQQVLTALNHYAGGHFQRTTGLCGGVSQPTVYRVESTFYFSDSTIAIYWVLNTTRKQRTFVHNRVQLICQGIREVVDREERIPLYYINIESNLADMITKPRPFQAKDVSSDSPWICGLP